MVNFEKTSSASVFIAKCTLKVGLFQQNYGTRHTSPVRDHSSLQMWPNDRPHSSAHRLEQIMRDGSKPAMVFAKLGRFHDPTRRKLIISGAPTRIHSFCSLVGGGSGENIFATCQFVAVRSREATQNPQNLLWWTVKVLFYWRIVQINVCRYTSFQYSSNRNLSEKSCGPISAHSPSAFQNTRFSGPLGTPYWHRHVDLSDFSSYDGKFGGV